MNARRVHERIEYELPVTIEHDGREVEAFTRNLSLGGMYLITGETLKYGTTVSLRFRLPTLKEETRCTATVRWRGSEGVGVQFGSLRALEVWGLNQLFKQLREPE